MINFPMQDSNSTMCGSFCSYFAHLIYDKSFNGVAFELVYINDQVLKRFLIRMLSHYLIIFLWLICQFSISFWTLYFLIIENFTRFLNELQLCVTIKVKNTKSIYGGIHHTSKLRPPFSTISGPVSKRRFQKRVFLFSELKKIFLFSIF